jgi:hypothetical protein
MAASDRPSIITPVAGHSGPGGDDVVPVRLTRSVDHAAPRLGIVIGALVLANVVGAAFLVGDARAASSDPSIDHQAALEAREPRPPADDHHPHKPPKAGVPVDEEPGPPGPSEKIDVPVTLNLYRAGGFRYQDTNYYACTATTAMNMLNFIALAGRGGTAFRWTTSLSGAKRDAILAWERTHDTMSGGNGSDPHGWRNALNSYGWGSAALYEGARYYNDYAYSTYEKAVKSAIRAMIRYRKPVGIAAWQGRHAQMLSGYDGLVGDPFALDSTGHYTNRFAVTALYLTDPLMSAGMVNKRIGYVTLGATANTRIRFQPYYETDSPYDDTYSAGWRRSRDEWYGRWVTIAPVR